MSTWAWPALDHAPDQEPSLHLTSLAFGLSSTSTIGEIDVHGYPLDSQDSRSALEIHEIWGPGDLPGDFTRSA